MNLLPYGLSLFFVEDTRPFEWISRKKPLRANNCLFLAYFWSSGKVEEDLGLDIVTLSFCRIYGFIIMITKRLCIIYFKVKHVDVIFLAFGQTKWNINACFLNSDRSVVELVVFQICSWIYKERSPRFCVVKKALKATAKHIQKDHKNFSGSGCTLLLTLMKTF